MKPSDALLDFGKPVAYYPGLVKHLGSINSVLFFCQIFYWSGKESDPQLGVFKSSKNIEEETCLSRDEQKTARKHLRDRGVLIETERRLEHKIYYRINLDRLNELLERQQGAHPESGNSPSAKGEFPHPPMGNSRVRNKEAENTPENTPENKNQPPSAAQTGTPQPLPVKTELLLPLPPQDEQPAPTQKAPLGKKRPPRQQKSKPCVPELVDDRYTLFVGRISAYWKFKNPLFPMPFDSSDGKRIKELLDASPDLNLETFNLCLQNRARSDVSHSQRPRVWIADVLQYAGGPLDRYGKPKQENGGGKIDGSGSNGPIGNSQYLSRGHQQTATNLSEAQRFIQREIEAAQAGGDRDGADQVGGGDQ